MSRRKEVIRVDDLVKVVNPEIVVRVGYPMSKEMALEEVNKLHRKQLHAFLAELGYVQKCSDFKGLLMETEKYGGVLDKIMRELAYVHLHKQGFGGRTRSVHTSTEERLRDQTYKVVNIRYTRVGEYYAPYSSAGSFWEEPEWEPGGLDKAKTVKILQLCEIGHYVCYLKDSPLEIQATDVVKVTENDRNR